MSFHSKASFVRLFMVLVIVLFSRGMSHMCDIPHLCQGAEFKPVHENFQNLFHFYTLDLPNCCEMLYVLISLGTRNQGTLYENPVSMPF